MQPEPIRGVDRDRTPRIVTGVVRRIDQLGRVVVPAELRRTLGLRQGDLVATRLENGNVVMTKVEPECAICGGAADLVDMLDKHICGDCVRGLVEKSELPTPIS
jgi:transcriptional pleiotropic regulator of transition state genes